MFSLNKKKGSQGSAEVHFTSGFSTTSQESNSKTWRSNEDVTGYAIFRLPRRVEFSRSKIVLKGVVITRTEDPRLRGIQRTFRTERIPILAVALDSRAWPDFESDNGAVKIPFRFNLEKCSRLSGTSELPPTIESNNDAHWWSGLKASEAGVDYDITYSVTASCFSTQALIASKSERITVLPVTESQPPLYTSHYPGEHFLAAPSPSLGRYSRREDTPQLQIAGQEPAPIRLDPSITTSRGSTQVPFVIKLLPQDGSTLDHAAFPEQCELTARLVTRTLITPNGCRAAPTIDEVVRDEDSFVRSSRSNEQTFTVSLSDWQRYTDGPSGQFAITTFPFLFSLSDDRPMSPSFFTSILSRRYAIEIKLRFPGTAISNLELSVPLQIVYEADDGDLVKVITK